MFIPVIMAGGSGSRLWPLSRSAFPKQFLSLDSSSQHTMLQATIERLQGLPIAEPIVISNEDHRFIVAEQIRRYGKKSRIILEPAGRNTAPAIALAAFTAIEQEDDPVLLVLAADHFVKIKVHFRLLFHKQLNRQRLVNLLLLVSFPPLLKQVMVIFTGVKRLHKALMKLTHLLKSHS